MALPSPPPAKPKPIYRAFAVLSMGALITGVYLRWHGPPDFGSKARGPIGSVPYGSESPFRYPNPPADLITTLQRRGKNDPPLVDPMESLVPAAFKDLCRILATDYPAGSYVYGATDPAQQARVEREGQELMDEVGALFSDKTAARTEAHGALRVAAATLYEDPRLNPNHLCETIEAQMDNPPRLF